MSHKKNARLNWVKLLDKKMFTIVQFYTQKLYLSTPMKWNRLTCIIVSFKQQGNIVGLLNKNVLFNIEAPTSKRHGFVGLGTSSFGLADFDNVKIMDSKMAETYIKERYQTVEVYTEQIELDFEVVEKVQQQVILN